MLQIAINVPVFIIGIGSIDYADVNDIATQTGGMYYNVSDVTSMDKIYEEIISDGKTALSGGI